MSKDKIEVSMNVYDIPIVVEALEEANKEIERLHSIIKEVREYCLEKAKGRLERTLYDDILEILEEENI